MTTTKLLLEYSLFADLILAVGVLLVMKRQRLLRSFPFLAAFIVANGAADAVAVAILFFRRYLFGISVYQAYDIYFYSEQLHPAQPRVAEESPPPLPWPWQPLAAASSDAAHRPLQQSGLPQRAAPQMYA